MDKNSDAAPEPNAKQRTSDTPTSEQDNHTRESKTQPGDTRESKTQPGDSSSAETPPSDRATEKDPPPPPAHQEAESIVTAKTGDPKMPSLADTESSITKKPAVRPLSPPRTDHSNGAGDGEPASSSKTVGQPYNPTNRPSSPTDSVPNITTPGISNYLRQQNKSLPQNKFQPSHDAQAAIQNLALQVREMSPMYAEESTAAAAPATKPSKTNRIISEMKERGEASLISSQAQSAAAAIHNIAFGVKNTVAPPAPGSEMTTSKEILLQRGLRQKAKKDLEQGSSGKKQQSIVDLSQGSDYGPSKTADVEVARMLEARKRLVSASNPQQQQQQMYRSTRQPWEKGESEKRRLSSKQQQQQHGQFHRSKAEEAAMMQNRLLQTIQTEQNNRARKNNNNNNAIGSGWTAREAALIAESNPDTVQKILAAQAVRAPAPPAPPPQQQFMWQQQQQQMERHAAEQRGSMGSSSNDASRRGVGSTDLAHNEAAMTTLVRKLLGQISVHGDEPPIVLGPQLITTISDKIKQVISRMVDIQDERFSERRGDKRMRNSDDVTDEEKQQHNKRLKAYAQQQSEVVHEQQVKINTLQRQLDERSAELTDQRNELSAMQGQYRVEDDSAIRNLLKQLDTGMQTASRQKKEITALRAVINQDAADIQQKDDVIEVLRAQSARDDETIRQLKTQTGGEQSEVTNLRREVKELRDTLQAERRQCESTTRAYMRAAVHAIKVQKSNLKE